MSSTCPSCGDDSVIWEEYSQQVTDGKPQQVCTECGLVLEEGCYTSDDKLGTIDVKSNRHLYESSLPTSYLRRNKTDSESKAKKTYEKVIERLGGLFDLPGDIIERSKELFGILYKADGFYSVAIENKKITAGCCLFAICRMSDIPMLIAFFTDALSCTKEKFSKEMKRLVEITDIKIPNQDISDYVEGYCRNLEMNDAVKYTTFDIIQVAKETWISQGRQTEYVLAAAVYIAWVAEDPSRRLKTSIHKFFQRPSMKCTKVKVAKQRYAELVKVLCKLAKEIPWVDVKDANLKTVVFNLKDIVNYQQSLIHEASTRIFDDELTEPSLASAEDNAVDGKFPIKPHETDATIVARDLATNTATTTELSLVATVTEHTDIDSLNFSSSKGKQELETESEGSSEEGHHYSIIVTPEENKNVEWHANITSESAVSMLEYKMSNESASSENNSNVNKSGGLSQTDNETSEISLNRPSSSGFKMRDRITEETIYIDHAGYNILKALPTFSSKSSGTSKLSVYDTVTEGDVSTVTPEKESSQSISEHEKLFASNCGKKIEDNEPEQAQEDEFSNEDCDQTTVQQNMTDESRSKQGRKRKRERNEFRIEHGEILPSSFVIARQISREGKKLKDESSSMKESDSITEVSNQEIDKDVEQYIRSEDEINFIKKLYAKKY